MSAKLWSAVAWNRFGSHLRILQTSGASGAVGFLPSSPESRNGLPKRFQATALQRLPPILISKLNAIGFEKPGYAHMVAAATWKEVVIFIFQRRLFITRSSRDE